MIKVKREGILRFINHPFFVIMKFPLLHRPISVKLLLGRGELWVRGHIPFLKGWTSCLTSGGPCAHSIICYLNMRREPTLVLHPNLDHGKRVLARVIAQLGHTARFQILLLFRVTEEILVLICDRAVSCSGTLRTPHGLYW